MSAYTTVLACFFLVLGGIEALAQSAHPSPVEADFVARNFNFASGETMSEVRLHYRTIGTVRKDPDGVARNAVLILHGTGGYDIGAEASIGVEEGLPPKRESGI